MAVGDTYATANVRGENFGNFPGSGADSVQLPVQGTTIWSLLRGSLWVLQSSHSLLGVVRFAAQSRIWGFVLPPAT